MSNNFAPFLAILHANYTFAFNATLFLLKHNMLFFNSMYTVCSDVLLALFQLVRVHQYPILLQQIASWLTARYTWIWLGTQAMLCKKHKTLTKPFTCWSKGYSCNFTPSVQFVFLSEMRKTNRALGLWRCYSWCCLFILSWPINCFPYLWLRQRAHTAPVGPNTASWYLTSQCTYWNTEIPTGLSVYAK